MEQLKKLQKVNSKEIQLKDHSLDTKPGWISKFFIDAVDQLEYERHVNKFYPFQETVNSSGDPIYRFKYRNRNFKRLLMLTFTGLIFYVLSIIRQMKETTSLLLLVTTTTFFTMSLFYTKYRILDIEQDGECYFFFIGNHLKIKGNVRDMYIRIRQEICTNGVCYYYLILSGFLIDEWNLTTFSEDYKNMKRHGKRMAYQLNVNFFDVDDISTEHSVRHMAKFKDYVDRNHDSHFLSVVGKRITHQQTLTNRFSQAQGIKDFIGPSHFTETANKQQEMVRGTKVRSEQPTAGEYLKKHRASMMDSIL